MGSTATSKDFDILIIGAGLSGITTLHHIRKLFPAWTVTILEAEDEVGGTWYVNRYPGARFDSDSVSYHMSWDKGMLQEWNWSEEFAPQPETLRYINRLCDRNDIRRDVQFGTRIATARWNDSERMWTLTDQHGTRYSATFVITCVGILSRPQLPRLPGSNGGLAAFQGAVYHTSRWPKNLDIRRDLAGKRVGVIGTAATGIQTITALSKEPSIGSITVFQRSASWCAPLRNSPISPEKMAAYKTQYDAIFARCAEAPTGFLYSPDKRKTLDVPEAERLALWEKLYSEPGFGKWLSVFHDVFIDPAANKLYSDWMADKIRARVNDPVLAEKLVPKDHGFGTKRVPLDSGYFEAYNHDNVRLVDLKATPIVDVTAAGIVTADSVQHDLDVLICATGFDAITGALAAIDWEGRGGRPLMDRASDTAKQTTRKQQAVWSGSETKTFLGLMAPDMPNMFMILGPHQPFGNITRSIENSVDVVMRLLQHVYDNKHTYVQCTEEAAEAWYSHVVDCSRPLLSSQVASWSTGVNTNIDGPSKPRVAKYNGTYRQFLEQCYACECDGWKSLDCR